MPSSPDLREWLETDGLGGYASGTVSGVRTRRYHALLCVATTPPVGRVTLVNGLEEVVDHAGVRTPLSAQGYLGDVVEPRGFERLESFRTDPWPAWTYRLPGRGGGEGPRIEREVTALHGRPAVAVVWRLDAGAEGPVRLEVRPLLSGRDHNLVHLENDVLRPGVETAAGRTAMGRTTWRPYDGVPAVHAHHRGSYRHWPFWYRRFHYLEESHRGLDAVEDLWAPGILSFEIPPGGEARLVLSTEPEAPDLDAARAAERARRAALAAPAGPDASPALRRLLVSADAYVVRRGDGRTIVAGYPWFTDWGRDAFIALRGLLLSTGRADAARGILVEWAKAVDRGMLPNHFVDDGGAPAFNSVDASLWYCVAAAEARDRGVLAGGDLAAVRAACGAILDGYRDGTRHGIRADADGLLLCGGPGTQLTWMDVKIDDWVVTPRVGKPVEVEALWTNALEMWGRRDEARRAAESFARRFWNREKGFLFDVVDGPGGDDARHRPNQVLAVALPSPLLPPDRARAVVDAVEARLLTPLGLRTLDPADPDYKPRYEGGRRERDAAYHQGTVWPWLLGPFVEAWVKVRGGTPEARRAARRLLEGIAAHVDDAGLGHVSEIADAALPHAPKGTPFQAWSVGEVVRLLLEVVV